MAIQDQILDAFRTSGKKRLTMDQLVELTGLDRHQVGSAVYRLIQAEIGLSNAVVKGKKRNGIYDYVHPQPKAPEPTAKPKAAEAESDYVLLRIVTTVPEGWSVAVEEETGRAFRLEKL